MRGVPWAGPAEATGDSACAYDLCVALMGPIRSDMLGGDCDGAPGGETAESE